MKDWKFFLFSISRIENWLMADSKLNQPTYLPNCSLRKAPAGLPTSADGTAIHLAAQPSD